MNVLAGIAIAVGILHLFFAGRLVVLHVEGGSIGTALIIGVVLIGIGISIGLRYLKKPAS